MKPILIKPPKSPHLVSFDGNFDLKKAKTQQKKPLDSKVARKKLKAVREEIAELQRMLYAHNQFSLLLVFQAMDAAGKDSTIRAVLSGVNPAGCQVSSFKAPSDNELDHDFLWRLQNQLPQRGRIGVFNRSHYEEVLVVRVHPEYLGGQRIPRKVKPSELWEERYDSIRDFEKHLARNGTVILKFWLNVSKDAQKERFLDRIDEDKSNWKFNDGDLKERALWKKYMEAYEDALNATSRPWAPWYAIPADDKPNMRLMVAELVRDALKGMELSYPKVSKEDKAQMVEHRKTLVDD